MDEAPAAPASEDLPETLVLFDGVCAVCDGLVQWLLVHDTAGRLHYAPLQGPTAAAVRARHPEWPAQLDSIVLVRRVEGAERLSWHTAALIELAGELPPPWRAARHLWWVPGPLRDVAYRSFAATRYALFGTLDQCRLPTEVEQARFLP
jgi:predicted DCC family thiol-disulfide oxidoreductase YuxK